MLRVAFFAWPTTAALGPPGCCSALPSTRGAERRWRVQDDSQGDRPENKHGRAKKGGRSVLLYEAAVTKQSQTRRSPQPLPRAATRRFAFGSVQGESRGHVGTSPSQPAANGSVRWNLCAPGSEPAAPAPTHPPFSSAKDKPTTSRWSFGGGRGGALWRGKGGWKLLTR